MRLRASRRKGTVVPLLAVSIVALLALIALAVDIGMVALARNQAQNAADSGAMAGVRQLTGDNSNNNNYTAATPAAQNAVASNAILGTTLTTGAATINVGYYAYDSTQQKFSATFNGTKPDTEAWSAVRVTVNATMPTFFAKVMGINSMPAGATATAVHRPRDVAIILDYSGSMKYSCEPAYPSSGDITGSLNPDPAYPKFGHWSVLSSKMQKTTDYVDGGGENHAPNNLTMDTDNGPAVVKDFLYRDSGGNLANAFVRGGAYNAMTWACPAPSDWDVQADTTSPYVGDKWPRYNMSFTTGSYARNVYNFLTNNDPAYTADHNKSTVAGPGGGQFDPANPASPQNNEGYGSGFKGYVMGPGHYGKSFFYWPPDPRFHPSASTASPDPANPAKDTTGRWMGDWRKRFFYNGGTTTPLDGDNSRLWSTTTKQWNQASGTTYAVNYNAIVAWIKSGPQVLPPNLRAGRVLYYSAIPDTIPSSGGTEDQRFWRSYIDYVIGNGTATTQKQTGYGRQPDSDSSFGTTRITARSSINGADNIVGNSDDPYMNYSDNPVRPRQQFWFGPLSMLCFLSDNNASTHARNWLPGSCHEAHCWQLKAGVNAALNDIQKNHPNDWASMISFSGLQAYTTVRVPLSRDYTKMKNSLFFPFNTLNNLADQNYEVRPYDSSLNDTAPGNVPNAAGSTSPECGFKVAYNQFSSRTGYSGRRGAAKMIIFETDGVPNTQTTGALTVGTLGAENSHYPSLTVGSNVGNANATVLTNAKAALQTLCNLNTHATAPGYATSKTPVRVHAIAFGDLMETTGTTKTQALQFLLDCQKIGNTSSASDTQIEDYKIIVGDYNTRIEKLRTAFERIMQSGVQVTLIK